MLATHPRAGRQSTDRGKRIGALTAWKGRIYSGYGDYGANTGPIAISPYDPATGTFEEVWVSDTEAIENYRLIRGRLYVPAIDRRRNADYAVGEPWSDKLPIVTTHAFDMVTLDGTDLWLVGSNGSLAAAWRSLDDGRTWKPVYSHPAVSGIDGDFARFYFAGAFGNRLFLQGTDYRGGPHPGSKVFDGTTWSDGPNLLLERGMGWRPVVFADHMIYQSWEQSGSLLTFDGQVVHQAVGWQAYDLEVDGGKLYVLAGGFASMVGQPAGTRVLRTPDLEQWSVLRAPAPEGSRSLALLNDVIYVAGTEAQMYHHTGQPAWSTTSVTWNALPSVRIAVPTEDLDLVAPASVPVLVETTDADGDVFEVEVSEGGNFAFRDAYPPYLGTVSGLGFGPHVIGAQVVDSAGASRKNQVTIDVGRGANALPVLDQGPSVAPEPVRAGEPVSLSASASDPDGDAVVYLWDLGDGVGGEGSPVVHTYAEPGDYEVFVIAFDGRGGVVTGELLIQVAPPYVPPTETPTPTATSAPTPTAGPARGPAYIPMAVKRAELARP